MQGLEKVNIGQLKNACASANAGSGSKKANVFVVTYESLLIDPFVYFNELVKFLGGDCFNEEQILQAVENGRFQRKHPSTLYSDVGLDKVVKNFLVNTKVNQATKECLLHQSLSPFPREEKFCFNNCSGVTSGLYECPSPQEP